MNASKLIALVLIVAGVLGLVYGGFTYTRETHKADIGPMHMSFDEKQSVNIPVWAGLATLVAGVLVLVLPRKT